MNFIFMKWKLKYGFRKKFKNLNRVQKVLYNCNLSEVATLKNDTKSYKNPK